MHLLEWLDGIDKSVFVFIHERASAEWLDGIMKTLRNAATWIPLYALILYRMLRYYPADTFRFVMLSIIVFAICDYTSASILKPWFARERPCYDADLQQSLRGLIACGGRYSLPSSHASNHFGLAAFWYISFLHISGRRHYWLWLWAALIGYAQVYVGKHFPLDIAAGMILGLAVGLPMGIVFKYWRPQFFIPRQRSTTA
jgi:membrane-associated phospholipid phosphatase